MKAKVKVLLWVNSSHVDLNPLYYLPHLKSLWWCIEEMKKNIDRQDAFISSGIRFHRLIAEIAQNEILIST